MNLVKLKTVSHIFEGEMIKDMLAEIGIEVFLADQNTPEHMDIYLGYEGEGVLILVDEKDLDQANTFLEADKKVEDPVVEVTENPMKFPYWIWIGFAAMLFIFILYNIWK
ncbi:MAG: DUF2007 domain-containing protein [Clostridia bacterium]|nr:DUF2007 domain-containing protein [Clostridia bacterium]